MEQFDNMTIRAFLDRVAADSPTLPAGGSATALCSALAAALGGFVARIARKKSGCDPEKSRLSNIVKNLRDIQEAGLKTISRDVDAYGKIMEAVKLPRGKERDDAMESAFIYALGPPMALVENSVKMLRLIFALWESIHPAARADALVAAIMAHACMESGLAIVRANIDCIQDDEQAARYRNILEKLQVEGKSLHCSIQKK